MAVIKKIDDPIRVKILAAMQEKGCVMPNIRQIKKHTGFHRATIKSSIDFLEKEKFITGYRPLLDSMVVGYKLYGTSYFQVDLTDKKTYNKVINSTKEDNSILSTSEVLCEGEYNLAVRFIARDIENYHRKETERYYKQMPELYNFIKKKSVFFLTGPYNKARVNEIDAVINLLKEAQGID